MEMSSFTYIYIIEIVFILIGTGIFFYGFILYRKKQLIENIPTSKIRSVPMGFAELKGKAKQKYPLKSPLSYTDCVYYKFLIEEERRNTKGHRHWVTINKGNSTLYFYVEDDTGKILVDPTDAEIILSYDYRHRECREIGTTNRRYTEWYILPGEEIYILGTVKKFKDTFNEKKEKLIQKLKELKQNREKLMEYDINKDGQIAPEEWDKARMDTEQKFFEEELKQPAQELEEDTIIGTGDMEKTFFISDKTEKSLTARFAIISYLCIFLGFCIIIMICISLLAHTRLLPGYLMIPWGTILDFL